MSLCLHDGSIYGFSINMHGLFARCLLPAQLSSADQAALLRWEQAALPSTALWHLLAGVHRQERALAHEGLSCGECYVCSSSIEHQMFCMLLLAVMACLGKAMEWH